MKKRVAIIFLRKNKRKSYTRFMVTDYARFWKKAGLDVFYLFGTKKYIPADLAIMNVNLSVVPESYIEFGQRYPITLNGNIRDIRKSSFSKLRIDRNDNYHGPVIVKTDLNYFGIPEKENLSFSEKLIAKISNRTRTHKDTIGRNYSVFDSIDSVPDEILQNPDYVVEKFIPEMENGLYCIRTCLFFGDRMTNHRLRSHDPIVKFNTCADIQSIDPHPDVLKYREQTGFDFGKFDYVVHQGKAMIFDINKTPGAGSADRIDPKVEAMRKYKAEGIYSYLGLDVPGI